MSCQDRRRPDGWRGRKRGRQFRDRAKRRQPVSGSGNTGNGSQSGSNVTGNNNAGNGNQSSHFVIGNNNTGSSQSSFNVTGFSNTGSGSCLSYNVTGDRGISNGIYFTVSTSIDSHKVSPRDPAHTSLNLVRKVKGDEFRYQNIQSGVEIRAMRVAPPTTLPD